MKKIALLSGIIFHIFFQHIKAQSQGINFGGMSNPVPSVSSLAAYNNVPMSNATGIPSISIPLLELPTKSKDIPMNIGLSYNVRNATGVGSEVGAGWSLFSGGVISRTIIGDIDERAIINNTPASKKKKFDDIYYYNLPGVSGRFRFIRNEDNTFELYNLSPNRVKIEYIRNADTTVFVINSFTITDAKGNKYYFDLYSISNPGGVWGRELFTYRSAFYLTKIVDAGNVEIANFSYEKKTRMAEGNTFPVIAYEYYKLKTAASPEIGKIEFSYSFDDGNDGTMNDSYQLNKVALKDYNNHIISQYAFEYSYANFGDLDARRMLRKVKKLDKNSVIFETTGFDYIDSNINRNYLKWVNNPSGGAVRYEFDEQKIINIKFYNSQTDPNPLKTTRFEYNSFADSSVSSGSFFFIEMDGESNTSPVYKNVKVIDDNNG